MIKNLVSVIIPTHDRSELLTNAINSVLSQTYSNLEILIIDDNSSDNTEQIVKEIKNSKILYFKNNVSLGSAGARNIGIKNSKGEFIAFLDDDDIWYTDKLRKQIECFKNEKVGLVYSSIDLSFNRYKITYPTMPQKKGSIYKDLLIRNYVGGTISVVVRRTALNDEILFDKSFPAREEYDLWIRISKKWEIDYIKEPLAKAFYRNEIKRISTNVDNYIKAINLINEKYRSDYELLLNDHEIQLKKVDQYFFLGSQGIKNYNKKLARKYFLKAFLLNYNFQSAVSYFLSFFGVGTVIYFKYLSTKLKRKKL